MQKLPLKLAKNLEMRKQKNAFRSLSMFENGIDFFSNDYLGFAASSKIAKDAQAILKEFSLGKNGATGSRLLSGNNRLFEATEAYLASFHQTGAALIFNSGYDANLGVIGSIPQRGDVILYDELSHASIRDAIGLSTAKAYKFSHNNIDALRNRLKKFSEKADEIYIVTESVFSMDGDMAPLRKIADLAEEFNAFLIVDEAHATGVFGEKGEGLVAELGIENQVFARINTFGKAIGAHGAVILGSEILKNYLVNFARSFIYTTAMPPHSLGVILAVYRYLETENYEIKKLKNLIVFFKKELFYKNLDHVFLKSETPVQSCIISGNSRVKEAALLLKKEGFTIKPILSPTVPEGVERLRICLHSFNSEKEIKQLLEILANFI